MPTYTYKVTATWWIDVEADDEATAQDEATNEYYDRGVYDGVESCDLMAVEEDEEDECVCSGCVETVGILDNGYCEECFDQGCDNDSNVH
jgi:hypothetical protein